MKEFGCCIVLTPSHFYEPDMTFEMNLVAFCKKQEDSTQHVLNSCRDIQQKHLLHDPAEAPTSCHVKKYKK